MTEFAKDPEERTSVETPCCATPVSLAFRSFLHRGKPRQGDDYEIWNLRCDGCATWWTVGMEIRVKYQRAECSTRYETRGRPVGAPHWIRR